MRSVFFCWSQNFFTPLHRCTNRANINGLRRRCCSSAANSSNARSKPEWWSELDYNSVLEERRANERKLRSKEPRSVTKPENPRIPVALSHLLNVKTPSSSSPNPALAQAQATSSSTEEVEDKVLLTEVQDNDPISTNDFETLVHDEQKAEAETELVANELTEISVKVEGGSGVPCGGCGAELHCQNMAIPGYMEGERFRLFNKKELRREICDRCWALGEHKTALKVTVPTEEYPSVLSGIKDDFAAVLLLVDLVDFPCSSWPGLVNLIGTKRPVFLVGNKVDLLPQDSPKYLTHVLKVLEDTVRATSLQDAKIVHSCLISATTGYGIEDLISNIFRHWKNKGHIYIMGCTNVGKSSLFNLFLQSDFCEVQVGELIQRATVSQWPGTTLSLLKFPILKATPGRMGARYHRLKQEAPSTAAFRRLRQFELVGTKDPIHAVPVGHVGQTFTAKANQEVIDWAEKTKDIFQVRTSFKAPPVVKRRGEFNPEPFEKRHAQWCYDTPGVHGPNQIASELTMEELAVCAPKEVMIPRIYMLRPGKTLFVGGLFRFDYTKGVNFIRLSVFTSALLPITVVRTEKAAEVYEKGFGTKVFGIPFGDADRLARFPPLKPTSFHLTGINHGESLADIVLSTLGWVSLSAIYGEHFDLDVHSPAGQGVFCRHPSLLPLSVRLRGPKIYGVPMYSSPRTFVPNVQF